MTFAVRQAIEIGNEDAELRLASHYISTSRSARRRRRRQASRRCDASRLTNRRATMTLFREAIGRGLDLNTMQRKKDFIRFVWRGLPGCAARRVRPRGRRRRADRGPLATRPRRQFYHDYRMNS